MKDNSPIFVVGMPRSGTTLISAMLSAHPAIAIAPETHFLHRWMEKYKQLDIASLQGFEIFWYDFSKSEDFLRLQIDKDAVESRIRSLPVRNFKNIFTVLLQMNANKAGKLRWGEKTPNHYRYLDLLLRWYPNSRIIYVLRDPRAVAASLLKVPWAHRNVDKHAMRWLASVRDCSSWFADSRVCVVKYEETVSNPEGKLRDLCRFLGEKYSPCMLNYRQVAHRLISGEEWKKAASEPINVSNVDKWKHQLTQQEVAIIEHFAKPMMRAYGYRPAANIFLKYRLKMIFRLKWFRNRLLASQKGQ